MTDILWIIVWILLGIFAIAIVNKIRFVVSTNIERKARTSALRDPNASMGEIVEAIKSEPEGFTTEIHARFWSLADDISTDADHTVAAIARTELPMQQFLCLVHEDALESFRSRTPKKSNERRQLESRIIAKNSSGEAIAANVNQFMEDIAARKPAELFGKEGEQRRYHDEELLKMLSDHMRAGELALTKLFERPGSA
ncbi:MAG: hypothetical protein OXE05_08605 [Chloroflexi bacterium]|nr:hypothetical protein [Chloroflexota bacterium]